MDRLGDVGGHLREPVLRVDRQVEVPQQILEKEDRFGLQRLGGETLYRATFSVAFEVLRARRIQWNGDHLPHHIPVRRESPFVDPLPDRLNRPIERYPLPSTIVVEGYGGIAKGGEGEKFPQSPTPPPAGSSADAAARPAFGSAAAPAPRASSSDMRRLLNPPGQKLKTRYLSEARGVGRTRSRVLLPVEQIGTIQLDPLLIDVALDGFEYPPLDPAGCS